MSANQQTYRPLLTALAVRQGMGEGAASRIAPLISSPTLVGQYAKYDRTKNNSTQIDVKRAPAAEVKQGIRPGKSMVTYGLDDYTVDIGTPIEFSEGQIQELNAGDKQAAVLDAVYIIRHAHETAVKLASFNTGSQADLNAIYGSGSVGTPSVKWDNASATAVTIKKDILGRRDLIKKNSGFNINTIVLPLVVYRVIEEKIQTSVQYLKDRAVTQSDVEAWLGVTPGTVVVPELIEQTANQGQTSAYSFMWDADSALFLFVDRSPILSLRNTSTAFATIYKDMPSAPFMGVSDYYDIKTKQWMTRCEAYFGVVAPDAQSGAALYDVLT